MKFAKLPLVILLSIGLSAMALVSASAQAQSTALERGYRTGYSDGYTAGFKDISVNAPRDYQNKDDYKQANRSYNEAWGTIDDYRDGYQQGFEVGYSAGYDKQQFNSTLPAGFGRRGAAGPSASSTTVNDQTVNTAAVNDPAAGNNDPSATTPASNGSLAIPRNTVLALELLTPVSTDASQRGDRIQAKVVEPQEFAGYIVDGHISEVRRPGKTKGTAQLQLSFDQIRSNDNRVAQLHAELIELAPMGGSNQPEVDSEGGVKGPSSTKDDVAKVGAATGVGAIIGAIAGGGKGAAIGAVIGGGAGTAGVMTQRGKDIRLDRGQRLKIRTSTDTSAM
jgi:hypothetical protein